MARVCDSCGAEIGFLGKGYALDDKCFCDDCWSKANASTGDIVTPQFVSSTKEEKEKAALVKMSSGSNTSLWVSALVFWIVIVLLCVWFNNKSINDSPSDVVSKFITYINDGKFSDAGQLLAPGIPWNPNAEQVSSNSPKILVTSSVEQVYNDEAVVYVEYNEDPAPVFNSNPFRMTVSLKKIDDKWLIFNMQ